METDVEIATRWRYLRDLLQEQLDQFEAGTLRMHSGADDVSLGAIKRLKKEIEDFDGLIRMSDKRIAKGS